MEAPAKSRASTTPKATSARPRKPESAAKTASRSVIQEAENWDARLGFLMHDVSRLRRIVFDEFMKPIGLTRSQWWILANLSRHDGMIQIDLANMLDLGKAALGGLLDRLEELELIERRPDPTDRRVKRIHLTSRGSQAIQEMRIKGHEVTERILEGLSQAERQTLVDGLALVKTNLLQLRGELQRSRDS